MRLETTYKQWKSAENSTDEPADKLANDPVQMQHDEIKSINKIENPSNCQESQVQLESNSAQNS